MARVQSPPVFSQLRVARNFTEQAAALRNLRDEIVGHVQQKEKWIQSGILEALAKALQKNAPSPSRLNGKESRCYYDPSAELTEEEVVRLLSLQLLASFSFGNPSFLGPLNAVGTVPAVLSYISPLENHPKIVLFALRVLRNITDATGFAPAGLNSTNTLSEAIFAPGCLEALYAILVQRQTDTVIQEQKRLVSVLISRLCKDANHQSALADAGILDALATILASFVVARGEVVPGADVYGGIDGLVNFIPNPARRGDSLALTLEAISVIIINSRFHAYSLLCSPAMLAVFPLLDFNTAGGQESRIAWDALEAHGYSELGSKCQGAMAYLLPPIPISQPRGTSVQFAQVAPSGFSSTRDSNPSSAQRPPTFKFTGLDPAGEDPDADDPGSPAIPWLIHLVRSTKGITRVMAASVLTSLYKAGFASPDREHAFGYLVVPLLCELIKDHDKEIPKHIHQAELIGPEMANDWAVLERTPEVLARLVGDSECLQHAAHECGTIALAAKLLKDAYDPLKIQSPPKQWSPNTDGGINSDELSASSRLGPPGMAPLYAHKIRMRESALKLVASMATQKDEHQKALSDQDVVPYVVESLTSSPRKPRNAKEKQAAEKDGDDQATPEPSPYGHNPNIVIVAACHALRTIARSVSVVRTTLQDHEVWKPLMKLLKHSDSEVRIAACGVVINVATSCSPMVDSLVDAGIVKVLCEHAHSHDPGLRLNSLWALKHLVLEANISLRKQVLEELEPGWLVQLISDDPSEDEAIHTARQRRAPDVDDDEDMDTETDITYQEESRPWTWQVLSRDYPTPGLSTVVANSPRIQRANVRLQAVREAELNPARKARNENVAIQEQGLGFIRNLTMLMGSKEEQTEIVDYVFSVLGQDRLFGILADKLKVRVVGAYGRRYSKGRDTVVLYPQARIVENLTYILVHIAASVPRHRQLVIAQTDLLKLLTGGHLNSKDVGVRRALCNLFDNLSCLENEEDRQPCLQRAQELEKLGVLTKLEDLEHRDADLDVRERAKLVVAQIKAPTA
ncbi:armadillo-type protein [Cladorrhinum sp. PSN259]|nr:armadillo-type protein [Cladorrhinum sp. PSN259]